MRLALATLAVSIMALVPSGIIYSQAGRGIAITPVKIPDQRGIMVEIYRESYALIIGMSKYSGGWPSLPGVMQDVRRLEEGLQGQGFQVETVLDPDGVKLREAFRRFISRHGREPGNRLLFFFAGHGHTLQLAYGEEMGYIVPADAPNPNREPDAFKDNALDMQQIEVYARNIESKHVLFVFDCCFSGSIFALSRAIPENISYKTSLPVRQFITSGSADEKVPDKSVFCDQFLEALKGEGDRNGDGFVTGSELGEFLQEKVVNYSRGSQHPQYGKIRNPNLDKGDFVFQVALPVDSIWKPPPPAEEGGFSLKDLEREVEKLKNQLDSLRKDSTTIEGPQETDSNLEATAWIEKGYELYNSGNYLDAIYAYNRSLELNSKNAISYNNRANAYYKMGKNDEAIKDYNKAIELNPNFVEAYDNRGTLNYTLGNKQKALADLSKALSLNPKAKNLYKNRGALFLNLGDYQKAINDYNSLIALDPQNAEAFYNRGQAYNRLQNTKEARENFDKAIEKNPNFAIAHNSRGTIYLQSQNHDQAISDFDKAIEINPDFALAYYNRSVAYFNIEKFEQSLSDCLKAKELDSKYSESYDKLRSVIVAQKGNEGVSREIVKKIVSQQSPRDYATIGEAINNASDNKDTQIFVRPGLYKERLVIDRPLTIIGEGPTSEIVIESEEAGCIVVKTKLFQLSGVTVRYKGAEQAAAIDILEGKASIEKCDISSNGACISISGSGTEPNINSCKIRSERGCGILCTDNSGGSIFNCIFLQNKLSGIEIKNMAHPIIKKCKISNGNESGILIHQMGKGKIEDCEISHNNFSGIAIMEYGDPTIQSCLINSNGRYGISVSSGGLGLVVDCDLRFNNYGAWDVAKGSVVRKTRNIEK